MGLARNLWESVTGSSKEKKADPKKVSLGTGKAQEAKAALETRESKVKQALKDAGAD